MHLRWFELKVSAAYVTFDSFVPLVQMGSIQSNLEVFQI